jgi:putative CocE/NonD family hydrolase
LPIRISKPGTYRGYASVVADGYERTSAYLTMRDGCRIAVDTYLPTRSGKQLDGPLPTVAIATGYRRAWRHSDRESPHVKARTPHLKPGDIATVVNRSSVLPDGRHGSWPGLALDTNGDALAAVIRERGSNAEYFLVHGYAVLVIDVRATGASFGANYGDGWTTGRDLVDIFAHVVAQPWCSGKIGMIGASWLGATQYFTITYNNPYLTAAIPQMAGFDMYESWFPGGACVAGFVRSWSERRQAQDYENLALPVDDDPTGAVMEQARMERRGDLYPTDQKLDKAAHFADLPTWSRDQALAAFPTQNLKAEDGKRIDLAYSALDFARAAATKTAVYFYGGWWDMFTRAVLVAYRNLELPKKILIGPWHHANFWDQEEALRWFDYWLKGIDNGITAEPPVVFSTSRGDGTIESWSATRDWPLAEMRPQTLHFIPASQGAGAGLMSEAAVARGVVVPLTVDYGVTAGRRGRSWYAAAPLINYTALHDHDAKGLIFETLPFERPLEITGHPILTLKMSSSGTAGIVVAYLEEVDQAGASSHIAEGVQNLAFRATEGAPIDHYGLPYRSYLSTTRKPTVPGEIFTLTFDLTPVSFQLRAGCRLRIVIHGADRDNYYAHEESPPPTYRFHLDRSSLTLPVIPASPAREALKVDRAFHDMPAKSRRATETDLAVAPGAAARAVGGSTGVTLRSASS